MSLQEKSSINQVYRISYNIIEVMPAGEYDQNKQTKYYEVMIWTVTHLSITYLDSSNIEAYFKLIGEVKEIKNTNNTFLMKLTDKLIGKL